MMAARARKGKKTNFIFKGGPWSWQVHKMYCSGTLPIKVTVNGRHYAGHYNGKMEWVDQLSNRFKS